MSADIKINKGYTRKLSGFAELQPITVEAIRFCQDNLTPRENRYVVLISEIDDFKQALAAEGLEAEEIGHG